MKLIDLIPYLIDMEKLSNFYLENNLNFDSEEVSIYMVDKIDVNSNIYFFEVEETDGEVEFEKEGVIYLSFFPLEHTYELVKDELDLLNKGLTNQQISERLVQYRIYDA